MNICSESEPRDDSATGQIRLYVDGSCIGNPGAGGWAYWLQHLVGGAVVREKRDSGFIAETTNNRMELTATLKGLDAIRSGKIKRTVMIYSDSQYVVNGMTKWRTGWQKRNWMNVRNRDLWQQLICLSDQFETRYHWVRGHAGNRYNELVDKAAFTAAQLGRKKLDITK